MTPPIAMLNPETAAPILDCSPDTVAELLNTGELPGLRYGRSWIIPPAALEQCLTSRAIEQMLARPDAPMPEEKRRHQLTRMYGGLHALETAPAPTPDDWRVVSDAVNLMETLVMDMRICEDASGLLSDAVAALALAGARHLETGAAIRLNAQDIHIVRAVLADYAAMLETLSERTMTECHRRTERRVAEIHAGKSRPHDVQVVAV